MLTREQRQLLGVYPASMIADTIIDQEGGIARIRAGCCGGSRLDGPIRHFNTHGGQIKAGTFGDEATITVTFAQLKRWAASVPAELRDQIKAVRSAQQKEAARSYKWCHCPDPEGCRRSHEGDPLYGGRHHPSEGEYDEHLEIVFDLRDQERDLLDKALGLAGEPAGQLDLFDELMGENA